MALNDLIRKHALANAYSHNGKASPGAIIGKLIQEDASYKNKITELQPEIVKVVDEVNKLSLEEQEKELRKLYPDFFERKPVEKQELPELPNAKKGKVVTRLAPEPNGYMHIGHAISFFFNEYYAKKYAGKTILRFEDTNPEKEKKEFYDSIAEDVKWLGIKYDSRKNNSDDLETFYKHAETLIKNNNVYMCSCPVEKTRENRMKGIECECRSNSPAENLALWKKMLTTMKEGDAVLRFKGDMEAKNTVMRDPTLFRIVTASHPVQKKKYRVWPLYDFANALEDAICGVTHALRSNEFHQRDELQNRIRGLLGLENPEIISYSRINVSDAPTSKRRILPLVESNEVTSWDDPRLATIKALKRRGILPETLRQLALEVRMTSGSTTIDWSTIFGINRKILDEKANRYYFVPNPLKLEVKNAPTKKAELKLHPEDAKRGSRKIRTKNIFYIPKAEKFKKGDVFRLKDLYNVEYLVSGKAKFDSDELKPSTPKIQWVTDDFVEIEVLVPGILGKEAPAKIKGYAEKGVGKLKIGSIIQFERFGFCRKDSENLFILTHK